jgi:hypothetical protein
LCLLSPSLALLGSAPPPPPEQRPPTSAELYGRELTDEEHALTDLDAINAAVLRAHAGLSYAEALVLWRTMHAQAVGQAARLTDAQLAAPGPLVPAHWSRPHLAEVVTALVDHYQAHMAPAA